MTVDRLLETLRARYPNVRGGNGLDGALEDVSAFDAAHPK
ncbi:MAG: hypothetical protein QG650_588 [Patescibacteria group bacterium]|nr:hypothetical protein [Patescibacteria group bacterium]